MLMLIHGSSGLMLIDGSNESMSSLRGLSAPATGSRERGAGTIRGERFGFPGTIQKNWKVLLFIGRGCYCKCTDAGVCWDTLDTCYLKDSMAPPEGERHAIWSSWMAEMRLFTLISLVPKARLEQDGCV